MSELTHYGIKGMRWGVRKELVKHPRLQKLSGTIEKVKRWNRNTTRKYDRYLDYEIKRAFNEVKRNRRMEAKIKADRLPLAAMAVGALMTIGSIGSDLAGLR